LPDIQITLTIPEAKVPVVQDGFLHVHPIPRNPQGVPSYGQVAWLRECIRRWVRDETARGIQAMNREAVTFDPDDEAITST